jgi:biopolymer transport protein ExbB
MILSFFKKTLFPVILATLLLGTVAVSFGAQSPTPPDHPRAGSLQRATVLGERLKQGGNTALVQLALSIFGAGFVFQQLFRLRRKYIVPEGLSARARELWQAGKFTELEALGDTGPSTLARVISFIAKNRNSPMVEVSQICGELATRELAVHYQRAYPLGIVATLAPLLGLLGMILGISTFETVALAGALGDPTQLASGISEALVTTGLGLAIAIPFLAMYHIFKHRTTSFGMRLEEEITSLLSAWLMKK